MLATALVGTLATDPGSRWYQRLEKPPWQPPGPVFGAVWTVVYALLAVSAGRALGRLGGGAQRTAHRRALGADLVLNAGWSVVFFRAHRPVAALVEVLALDASTALLLRRTWRVDRAAGLALLPYAAWLGVATALTASIVRRNR